MKEREVSVFLALILLYCVNPGHTLDAKTIQDFVEQVHLKLIQAGNALSTKESTPDQLSRFQMTLQAAMLNSRRIRCFLSSTKPCAQELLESILDNLCCLEGKVSSLIERLGAMIPLAMDELTYHAPTSITGEVGRPRYVITREQLETMRTYRLSWMDISKALGVSISTIWRLRVKYGICQARRRRERTIEGHELSSLIAELQATAPNIGITMIEGAISARGLYAARSDIANMLVRLDPIGAVLRWNDQNPRTAYSVPGPNSLWHLDGNHKLIRWKLVVHGGIDGYSRMVVFLKCSNNNRASTVAQCFLEATELFCWPSRVRTDKGGENTEVARIILEKRGEGRGSIIQGSSVHNQRIERLWRDMRQMATEYYRRLFYFLEDHNLLDPDSDADIFCLHYVFLPRINANLRHFSSVWNCHKLSTEHQKTPNQLYILGMMSLFGSNYTAVKDFFEDNEISEEMYGIEEPNTTESIDEDEAVNVPPVNVHLPEECIEEMRQSVDPQEQDGNHGISVYIRAKAIVCQYLNN